MENYKKDLEERKIGKSEGLVLNDGPLKAAVFMGELLSKSKHSVKIYSSKLDSRVTKKSDFFDSFKKIIEDENIKVEILLGNKMDNPDIENILNANKKNNNFLLYLKDEKCAVDALGGNQHFTIVDSVAYRLENDIENFKAFGNFNDRETAQQLERLFDYLYKNCTDRQ